MNTEQNYVGKGSNANTLPPTAQNAAQPSQPADYRQLNRACQTLASKIPFEPAYIELPVSLQWHGQDEDCFGSSNLSILYEALVQHKKRIESIMIDCKDKQVDLELIDELINNLHITVFTRFAAYADLLHKIKYSQF